MSLCDNCLLKCEHDFCDNCSTCHLCGVLADSPAAPALPVIPSNKIPNWTIEKPIMLPPVFDEKAYMRYATRSYVSQHTNSIH